jgi:hypothetical protein
MFEATPRWSRGHVVVTNSTSLDDTRCHDEDRWGPEIFTGHHVMDMATPDVMSAFDWGSSLKERLMSTVLLCEERCFRRLWRRLCVVLVRAGSPGCVPGCGRGGQDRPQAARRGSLEGPGQWLAQTGKRTPPGGSWSAWLGGCLLGWVGMGWPSPGPVGFRGRQRRGSGAGHPFAASRRAWSGAAAARRVQSRGRPRQGGGHDPRRTRAVAASELAHPAFWARQRISPSRRP